MGGNGKHHHDVCRADQCLYREKGATGLDSHLRTPLAFWYSTAVILISSLTIQMAGEIVQRKGE